MLADVLSEFKQGVSEVEVLLALSDSLPALTERSLGAPAAVEGPGDTREAHDRHLQQTNAIRRAAVVLLVSHFENFLKAGAEEFIDVLSTGDLESRQIPTGIRELHTFPRLQEAISSGDATQRAVILKKLPEVIQLWNDSAKPARGTLKPALLVAVVTSAKAEKIDGLFALLGHQGGVCDGDIDIPLSTSEMESVNIRYSLEDLVSCRNSIAHGDATRLPTADDVDRYLKFLNSLAARLARKFESLDPVRRS